MRAAAKSAVSAEIINATLLDAGPCAAPATPSLHVTMKEPVAPRRLQTPAWTE